MLRTDQKFMKFILLETNYKKLFVLECFYHCIPSSVRKPYLHDLRLILCTKVVREDCPL